MPSDLHVFLLRYQSFISILFYILSAIYLKGLLARALSHVRVRYTERLQTSSTLCFSHNAMAFTWQTAGGLTRTWATRASEIRDLKKEKWRLRPFSFGWVTAQLHDLWPGESREARGHLGPGQETGEKRVSRDKFCFDCIFLFKYYTADGCINLLAF